MRKQMLVILGAVFLASCGLELSEPSTTTKQKIVLADDPMIPTVKITPCDTSWDRIQIFSTEDSVTGGTSYNCRDTRTEHIEGWHQRWNFSTLSTRNLNRLRNSSEFCVKFNVDLSASVFDNLTTSSVGYRTNRTYPNRFNVTQVYRGSKSVRKVHFENYTTANLTTDVANLFVTVDGGSRITCLTTGTVSNVGGSTTGVAGTLGAISVYYR